MPGTLLLGTLIDALQFKTFSITVTFAFSAVYLVLCALAMLVMVLPIRDNQRVMRFVRLIAPLVQQFTIGALLSTSLLFYWFSGALSASWPLLFVIALLMVFNEAFRGYFLLPTVQVAVYSFVLFSLGATGSAFIFNSLSPWAFIFGGLASTIVAIALLVPFIHFGKLVHFKLTMCLTVIGVFLIMSAAYFLRLIPPIPLSLREAGIYYQVARSGGDYIVVGEDESWFSALIPGQTMYINAGDRLYAFTTIFAPADLSTTITHRWEYRDDEYGWVTMSELPFAVTGGREDGFRGYSYKSQLREGRWRVIVETSRRQVLGRIPFTVEFND